MPSDKRETSLNFKLLPIASLCPTSVLLLVYYYYFLVENKIQLRFGFDFL